MLCKSRMSCFIIRSPYTSESVVLVVWERTVVDHALTCSRQWPERSFILTIQELRRLQELVGCSYKKHLHSEWSCKQSETGSNPSGGFKSEWQIAYQLSVSRTSFTISSSSAVHTVLPPVSTVRHCPWTRPVLPSPEYQLCSLATCFPHERRSRAVAR